MKDILLADARVLESFLKPALCLGRAQYPAATAQKQIYRFEGSEYKKK
jgi:hypothetical protein